MYLTEAAAKQDIERCK